METSATFTLPRHLYTAEQVRELDRIAIEEQGIPGVQLMKRAGRVAFEAMLQAYPSLARVSVFCGSGNNAGDGYVVAALAAQRKIDVRVIQVGDALKLGPDAKAAHNYAKAEGVTFVAWGDDIALDGDTDTDTDADRGANVLVDALLGTGFKPGQIEGNFRAAIEKINSSGKPTVSIDLPSGLCADTGAVKDIAVKASLTVTFIGVKRGLLTGRGPALSGALKFDSLQIDESLQSSVAAEVSSLNLELSSQLLSPREADAHKGNFGHVMIIGGDVGMGGAPLMAVEAAARVGAGLVSVATRPEHVAAILARRPEAMVSGVPSGQALEPLLERPSVLVVGPGMGRSAWSEQMLQQALKTDLPLVLDADALNIISEGRLSTGGKRKNWILTPHPGEAARLLGCNTKEVQADRFAAVEALQKRYGGVVVLKGAGTLIAASNKGIKLSSAGNPGMASGGMGDVLSGILGGLLAQGLTEAEAAEFGVSLHGAAADKVAAEKGAHGMLATDLVPALHSLMNELIT